MKIACGDTLGPTRHIYDEDTVFVYNYYRTYDPSTGRYLESDPIGLGGGLNTYGYVGGNPLTGIDPLGLAHNIIVVGDPGLLRYNAGQNFDRVAETLKKQIESSDCGCDTADIVRASNVDDLRNALTSGSTIDGNVYYVGHGSANALYIGEQSGVGTNLDLFSLGSLPRTNNLSPDSELVLLSCNAGRQGGGEVSIAQMIANRMKRNVTAYPIDTVFSPNPNSAGNGATPGSQPPATGPLHLVPVIDGVAPIKYGPN